MADGFKDFDKDFDKDFGEGSGLSDEDIARAMADFEREFEDLSGVPSDSGASDSGASDGGTSDGGTSDGASGGMSDAYPDAGASVPSEGDGAADADEPTFDVPDDASSIDPSFGFDDALAGLLGDKAKHASIVTTLASAELLAAFCQLSDISADVVGSNQGAVAVLRNLDGDSPEAAARDITTVVAGMSVVLGVNRADKLEITLYSGGKAGRALAPPILFNSTSRFVEDLMLGITTVAQLREQGFEVVDSADLDHARAMRVIAAHTRFGDGGSTRGSSVQ